MTITITNSPQRQYHSAEDAARDIKIYFPWGRRGFPWSYKITPIHMATGGTTIASDRFAVKVYAGDGPFLGYAYREEEDP